MIQEPFELIEQANEEHPLLFLSESEKCFAVAKAKPGYVYLVRKGKTWKIIHVHRRNVQSSFKVVWTRHVPNVRVPLTPAKLDYFEQMASSSTVKVKRSKSRYPKDYQREKVYAWDIRCYRDIPGLDAYTPLSEAIPFVDKICEELNQKPIKVRYLQQRKNTRYGGYSHGSTIEIFDPIEHSLIHEVAHIIHTRMAKQLTGETIYKHSFHGPEFVAIYAFLLSRYTTFSLNLILASLEWDEIDIRKDVLKKLIELYPEKPATEQ